ncbi:MAG: hypothetical protein ACJ71C_07220 [Nitrososphaeraceae archaeon]
MIQTRLRKLPTEIMTIVPPGAKFITYNIDIPPITDMIAMKIDINKYMHISN